MAVSVMLSSSTSVGQGWSMSLSCSKSGKPKRCGKVDIHLPDRMEQPPPRLVFNRCHRCHAAGVGAVRIRRAERRAMPIMV